MDASAERGADDAVNARLGKSLGHRHLRRIATWFDDSSRPSPERALGVVSAMHEQRILGTNYDGEGHRQQLHVARPIVRSRGVPTTAVPRCAVNDAGRKLIELLSVTARLGAYQSVLAEVVALAQQEPGLTEERLQDLVLRGVGTPCGQCLVAGSAS